MVLGKRISVAYSWLFSGLSSVGQVSSLDQWSITPNPVKTQFILNTPGSNDLNVFVFNAAGQLVRSYMHQENGAKISTNRLRKGSYFVHIKDGEHEVVRKIEVVR